MKAISLLVLACFTAGCTGNNGDTRNGAKTSDQPSWLTGQCIDTDMTAHPVSIASLAKDPDRYDGKLVSVSGYYYSYFEHSAIYSTQETEPYSHDFSDGVWIQGISPFAEISGKYLTISGEFSSKVKGHGGQWPGTICATSTKEASPDAA